MATITGLTAARMAEIEGASVIDGEIINNHLILTRHDGTTIDAGLLPPGPVGPEGPPGVSAIPGEIKLWPGSTLPALANYGKWVWADGAVYPVATYPIAASHIAAQWRTFAGASDPGASNFRVPDLRGLAPVGLDAMPGGARANRLTRSVAIVLAGKTGEELHILTINEMPVHGHPLNDPGHAHSEAGGQGSNATGAQGGSDAWSGHTNTSTSPTGITIGTTGGNIAHENMQPTVFVPYIVKLD
jgi:microcystin-dependent protein